MTGDLRDQVSDVAICLGLPALPEDWTGCDAVWPLLERMREEGAVVLVKLDGERGPGDNGAYTVLASGGGLDGDFVRIDSAVLEEGLATVILGYAEKCW